MKKNYDIEMQKIEKTLVGKPKLLLHSCCAPCSSACLERLFKSFQVTVLYYNPNIDDVGEYEKRKSEQIRFLKETGYADFLDCDHEKELFFRIAAGLENEPERGKRCYLCYQLRLEKTAKTARENGFDYFCTTLSLSPYKNAEWINEIGQELTKKYGVQFLPSDFKKQGGYLRSIELSKKYALYRQDYCGCVYSKTETEKKREK
ncbi:MAG: epoxyqueuosine reductase QueH [Clostridia bacterium]|nr:epoxyqueuosine reductase QueH [Clostridia bacterium]